MSTEQKEEMRLATHDRELTDAVRTLATLYALNLKPKKGATIPRLRQAIEAVEALEAWWEHSTHGELGDAFLLEAAVCLDLRSSVKSGWPSLKAIQESQRRLEQRQKQRRAAKH